MVVGNAPAENAKQCLEECNSLSTCAFWDFGYNYCRLRSDAGNGQEVAQGHNCGSKNCYLDLVLHARGCPSSGTEIVEGYDKSVQYAVSCCSTDGKTCTSPHSPSCQLKTYDEAVKMCEAVGRRLCAKSELENCCGTGCDYDWKFIWVVAEPYFEFYQDSIMGTPLCKVTLTDVRANKNSMKNTYDCPSDKAGKMVLCNANKGTNITVFDNGDFSLGDDWASIIVNENFKGCITIGTFQETKYVGASKQAYVNYGTSGNLDNKVSSFVIELVHNSLSNTFCTSSEATTWTTFLEAKEECKKSLSCKWFYDSCGQGTMFKSCPASSITKTSRCGSILHKMDE